MSALELLASPPAPARWHFIRVLPSETEDEVKARYEAERGPIRPDDHWLVTIRFTPAGWDRGNIHG